MSRSFWHAFLLGLLNGLVIAFVVFAMAMTLWGCARQAAPEPTIGNTADPVSYGIDSRCESKLLVNGQCVPFDWVVAACSPKDAWCDVRCFKPTHFSCQLVWDGCHWRCADQPRSLLLRWY